MLQRVGSMIHREGGGEDHVQTVLAVAVRIHLGWVWSILRAVLGRGGVVGSLECLLSVCLWFLLFTSQSRPWTEAWRSTWSGNRGRERALGHLAGLSVGYPGRNMVQVVALWQSDWAG